MIKISAKSVSKSIESPKVNDIIKLLEDLSIEEVVDLHQYVYKYLKTKKTEERQNVRKKLKVGDVVQLRTPQWEGINLKVVSVKIKNATLKVLNGPKAGFTYKVDIGFIIHPSMKFDLI